VFGGHRPGSFDAIIYTDEFTADDALASVPPDAGKVTIKRTLQVRLVFDPVQAKSFAHWLNSHIQKYEEIFGKIPSPGDIRPGEAEKRYTM